MEEIYKSGEWKYEDYYNLTILAKEDIKAIRQNIFDEVASESDLADLNSTSEVAIWRLMVAIWAFVTWILQSNWVRYEARLKQAAREAIAHNTYWYAQRAKEFQLGDTLNASTGAVAYPVIDVTKQIVKAASIKEVAGDVIIKVAKDAAGVLVALDSTELLAFSGYIDDIRDAGVRIQIVSQNSDLLKITANIYYHAIIPLPTIKAAVELAITNYLKNLPFDGIVRRNHIIDAVQAVQGVIDMKITDLQATINYVSTPVFVPIDVSYETVAGYISIDNNYPLSVQLNYIPNA